MKCKAGFFIFLLLTLALSTSTVTLAAVLESGVHAQLQQIREVSKVAAVKLKRGDSVTAELERLNSLTENLQIDHLLLQARFAQRSEQIAEFSDPIQQRQQTMAQHYAQIISDLLSTIKILNSTVIPTEENFQDILLLINKSLPEQKYPILGSLPYQNLHLSARPPAVLPMVTPAYQGGSSALTEGDTRGTADTQITPEIAALAESLDWNPLNIYAWVTNNIETEWYWGSMKGAAETLRQKSGNDADQAALLIALMRAANFPARYVRGVIEFDPGIERLQGLVGLDDPLKAVRFLQQAGIPAEPVLSGGRISNVRIEHVWVEVYVPYANYRGAVLDEQGKLWLPLDTHLKPEGYLFNQATNKVPLGLFDSVRDDYLQVSRPETPLEYLRQQVEAKAATTWNETLATRQLNSATVEVLPASLQFKIMVVTGESASLPADLIQTITFRGGAEDGTELFSLTLPVSEVSNRQVVLSYEPESLDDQQLIDAHGGLSNTPAYLVRLRPVLLIDGEREIVARDGLPMGDDYQLTVQFKGPSGSAAQTARHIVGNPAALGIVAQQALPTPVLPEEEQNAVWMLWETAQDYIGRWNTAEEELAAFFNLRISRPFPTLVTVGGVLEVSRLLGMPQEMTWKGLFIDAGLRRIELAAQSGEQQRVVEFMRLAALQGSVLEQRIFEDRFQVASVCTARVLASANESGNPTLSLDSSNATELLPTLLLPEHIRSDIEAAVQQGMRVTLPAAETTLQLWSGFGYLKEDPLTGEAGYMLSGMIAGGMTIEEFAEDYRKNILQAPFADPPNTDILAAVHIAKITVSDLQSGTVGQQLAKPLAVLVTDIKGRPVVGARVTFTQIAGHAKQVPGAPPVTYLRTTDTLGIARALTTLGEKTDDNPSFQKVNQTDTHVTQVGVNQFDASVESYYGDLSLTQPFEVYGRPDVAHHLQKFLGDGNSSTVNNPAGSLLLKVFDQYENPVSNVPVTFTAHVAQPEGASSLPADYRNIEFYQQQECKNAYPIWDDCKAVSHSSLTLDSSYHGAMVDTLLGNSLATRYTVRAGAPGVADIFFTLYSRGLNHPGEYYPPKLSVSFLSSINENGQRIDAVKVGNAIGKPLQAALVLTYADFYLSEKKECSTQDADGNLSTYDCWDLLASDLIQTRKITNGKVTFDPQTGGQTTATKITDDGLYQASYTAGEVPVLNLVDILGEAQVKVPVVYGTVSGDTFFTVKGTKLTTSTIAEQTVTLKSGQIALFDADTKNLIPVENQQKETFSIYGVDVPTQINPELVMLGDFGMARQDVTVGYSIEPQGAGTAGYTAQSAQIDLFVGDCADQLTDPWVGSLIGDAKQGAGQGVYSRGSVFSPNLPYCVQLVLNRGTSAEIRGTKMKLQTLYADLDIDSDNNAGWQADGTHNPPSRNPLEDQIEDLDGQPGKVLRPNFLDVDGDKVPGYADGFDGNDKHRQSGDGASASFYPLKLTLDGRIDGEGLEQNPATLVFDYSGSDPAVITSGTAADSTVSYPLPQGGGAMRLWTKDGQFSRNAKDVADGGDYITPGKVYPLSLIKGLGGLFVEGVRGIANEEEKKITLKIDPDGPGPLPQVDGDQVFATPIYAALVPDYDHNRVIDDKDRARAELGDTYYFWINDDDDSGETGGNDILGDTGFFGKLDFEDTGVDGVRDLIDFFPVAFDLQSLAITFPLPRFKYRLRADDEQVNLLFPGLNVSSVGNYLVDVPTAKRLTEQLIRTVKKDGDFYVTFAEQFAMTFQQRLDALIEQAAANTEPSVLLFEGNKKSTKPLILDVLDESDQKVFSAQLNFSLDGVEQMFRHVNLVPTIGNPSAPAVETGLVGEHGAEGGEQSRFGSDDFANKEHFDGFDADLNERYFVLLHGANVDGQQARGWHSEMFKRLYWSGSKAKFVGVSWYGSEGSNPNYQTNVVNAFQTAAHFGQEVVKATEALPVTIMAHSLGNMVVSSYLNDHYQQHLLNVTNYFLFNAAVALEAYLGDYQQYAEGQLDDPGRKTFGPDNSMVHSNWFDYDKRLGSSEWHQLFPPDDPRRTLTWRNRFENLPESINYSSFYSTGDEVLATYAGESADIQVPDVWNSNLRRYAWVLQEKWKGRDLPLGSTDLMGWGFNQKTYRTTEIVDDGLPDTHPWYPTSANSVIQNDELITEPFFRKPEPGQLGNLLFEPTVDVTYVKGVRDELLALTLPALTLVTGGWSGETMEEYKVVNPDNAIDMNDPSKKNGWPSNRGLDEDWKHSDIKDVGYVFLREIFQQIVESGSLQ